MQSAPHLPRARWLLRRVLRAVVGRPLRWAFRRRKFVVFGGLAFVALVGLVALRMRGGAPLPPEAFDPVHTELSIDAPESARAGEPIPVVVSGPDLAEGAPVTLFVETGYENRRVEASAIGGAAMITVEPWDGPASGLLTLTATSGRSVATATVDYQPGPAVDPIETYLGPRTIDALANDISATMIVVVPEDRYGNPVADGTPVLVDVTRPDLDEFSFTMHTDRLLAWRRIVSGIVAGRSKVAVTVDGAHGDELDFLEVAGSPQAFDVIAIDPPVPADGRSIVRVETTELADEFGNVLPDGVVVYADVNGPGGTRRLRAQVIKGAAQFAIEAPARPGVETVVVVASGTVSSPLGVEFPPMVTGFVAETSDDRDGIRVVVGPVISTLDSYVPDGTPVVVTTPDGVFSRPTFDGRAEIVVPATTEALTIDVLGATETVRHTP